MQKIRNNDSGAHFSANVSYFLIFLKDSFGSQQFNDNEFA